MLLSLSQPETRDGGTKHSAYEPDSAHIHPTPAVTLGPNVWADGNTMARLGSAVPTQANKPVPGVPKKLLGDVFRLPSSPACGVVTVLGSLLHSLHLLWPCGVQSAPFPSACLPPAMDLGCPRAPPSCHWPSVPLLSMGHQPKCSATWTAAERG